MAAGTSGPTVINVATLGNQGGQDSGLITGNGLGGSGAGSVNVVVSTGYAVPGTQGGGGAGSETIPIRPDLLGDITGGSGTGFITRDTGNILRPLLPGELSVDMIAAVTAGVTSNTGLTAPNNATTNRIIASQTINSLTLLGAGTVTLTSGLGAPAGVFAANGLPLTLTAGSGGILALTNATIGIGAITTGGVTGDYHVVGAGTTLTLNGSIISSTSGIVKADAGTLVLNARQYYTGGSGTTVNGGTLRLGGGDNTIVVQPTGSVPTVLSLFMNGGTLDLNGTSQIVERISNNNSNAGIGGIIVNSAVAGTVTLTSASGTNGTAFAGSIGTGLLSPAGNAISFVKSGNSTLVLTNVNTYTGATVIRGGGLTLQDSGTLAQTSSVTVNFGTLLFNEAGLNPLGVNPVRTPVAAPITLNGALFQQNSGGSLDANSALNTVILGSGASNFVQSVVQGAGSSAMFSIASLVQQNNAGTGPATANFSSANGTLGGGGLNNNEFQISSITPSGGAAAAPASLLSNGMLPAWITVSGSDFASYLTVPVAGSVGIGAIGSTNYPAYAAPLIPFSTTAMPAAQIPANANSANNLSVTATVLPVAARTVNSLAGRNPAANVDAVIPINLPSDTLTIASGGLLLNSSNGSASITVQGGRISGGNVANTAGALYVTATGGNPLVINSQIVDNGNQVFSANYEGVHTDGTPQSSVITVGSTSGLVVGQTVSGPGITGGSTITAITSPTTFTISNPTTAASFLISDASLRKTNSALTSASAAVNVANTGSLAVGMYVTGPGIPAGTTVTALGTTAAPTTITLSNNATATLSQQNYFLSGVGNGQLNFPVSPAQAATLRPGMTVTGTGIPVNTTVAAVGSNSVTLSNPTTGTAATQLISFGVTLNFARLGINVAMPTGTNNPPPSATVAAVNVNNVTGLVAGMQVSGPGIPAGTVILGFGSTTNTVPNNTTVFIQAPTGQNFDAVTSNNGINFVFGTGISVGNGTAGAVSLVKTGAGTLTLTPQLVMNGSMRGSNQIPNNVITVPTTADLVAGMTVSGSGIPAGSTITTVNGTNTFLLSNNVTVNQGTQLSFGPGTSGISLPTSAFSNNHTGGTFVNQGTLALGGFAGATVIPGALTINNAGVASVITAINGDTVTSSNSINLPNVNGLSLGMGVFGTGIPTGEFITGISGNTITISTGTGVVGAAGTALTFANRQQIAATANVTLNGGGALSLVGTNTLGSVTFNSGGSSTTPAIVIGSGETLTLTNGITVTNDSLSLTPVIFGAAGATLTLPNSTITTSGASPDSLLITAPLIPTGALVKNGTGSLVLGPTVSLQQTSSTTNGSNTITVANGSGLAVGMAVSGTGIAANATIRSINANSVTLTNSATTSATNIITFAQTSPALSTFAGGVNLNGGSVIFAQNSTQLNFGGATTSGSATVTVASTAGLAVGMGVSGTGLPAGEYITAIGAGNITITTATGVTTQPATTLSFTGANTVLAGPVGTGPVNMANGTAILSDGTLRSIGNAVNIALNATFGPLTGGGTALAGNGVTLTGPVTLTGGGAHTITVPDLQNVTTIAGTLSGGASLNLTKAGTGTLVLSNASAGAPNTYTGTTAMNVVGGVLKLGAGAPAAVPAGMSLSVSQGAVYDINGNANQVLSSLSNPTPGTAGNGGLVTNSGGATTLFVGGASTVDNSTNVSAIFDGMLTAATLANLSLTKVGTGTLTLNGSSNYTGATAVNFGKLIVNGALGATTVTVNTGATFGGTGRVGVNAATPGGIFPTTGGSVVLAGGNFDLRNGSIGTFTVNSTGTGTALTVGAGSSLNFDFSTTSVDKIDLGNNNLQSNGTLIPVNFTALGGTLANGIYNLITFGAGAGAGTYALGTGAPVGSALTLTGSALELNVGNVPLLFFWKGNLGAGGNGTWNTGGVTNWVRDTAGGAAANTIPNATSVVNFNATTPANFNTSLGANFTIDQLLFNTNSTSTLTIGGAFTLTLNNNLAMATGTASVNITTNGLVLGSPQTWTNASTSSLTVTAPVTGSSPLTIASTSTGRVILNGTNSGFTGGITVNGNGTNTAVQLGSGTALGLTVAGLNNNPLVVNNGAVDMNGQNATISSLSSTANTGIIRNDLTGTTSILSVIQGGTTTYSGVFKDAAVGTGKVALIVDGGGTLQLTTPVGTNVTNYSGGTTIGIVAGLGATVKMGNSGSEIVTSLGTGPVTINNGGTLSFSPGSVTTAFNIANSFILAGGQIQSSGGNQHLLANSAVGAANINVTAPSSITPSTASGQDLFIDGVLTGSAALTVGGSGSGKVILTNNSNTYNGTLTSSSAGNLQLAGTLPNSTALASADVILNSGANGLSFASPVTSATFGTLQGSGNFALQNNAATPLAVTLTVGGNNNASPLTYGGVISNSASGINGSLVKIGTGTLILSGLSTYRGATTVNAGVLLVNNNSLTGSVTGLGSVSVTGTATLGGNGVIQGGNNLAAGSVSLAANTFLDPGLTTGGFGTLRFGVQSAAAFDTTLTLASNSTYKFDLGAGPGSQDRALVVGQATISGAKLAITAGTGANTPDQGNYTILSATPIAAVPGVNGTFTGGVTGTPANYSVVYNTNTVDLQRFSTIGTISTTAGLQVIKGATVAFPVTVANSAPSGSADLTFTASAGTNTTGSVSALAVSAGSTNTGAGLSFNSAPAGVLIGTGQTGNFTVTAVNSTTNTQLGAAQPGTVTVDVFDHAAFTGFTGGTLSFQPVRLGYVGPVTSTNSLSVTNLAGHRVNLKGSTAAPIGNISLNSISGVLPSGSPGSTPGLITASLLSGQAAGPYSQVFSYSLGDDSTLNGSNNGALGSVNIIVNGDVYTGQGIWGGSANGSWGTFTRWAVPGGFPGLDGAASVNDTATFGSTLAGSATLDGVSPALTKITFNATNGTIAQGTGGSVTLQNDGSQTPVAPSIVVTGGTAGTPAKPIISAPMVFADTPNLAPSTVNDQLTISGPISGPGGVNKIGAGTAILSGTNTYLGKTSVTAGTLSVTNETNLGAPVSGVPVPDQISLDSGGKLAFTGDANIAANQGITVGSGNGTLDVVANKTVVVNSVITGTLTGGSTTGTLTKTGPGTLNIRNNVQPSDISLAAPAVVLTAGTLSLVAGPWAGGVTATSALNTGAVTFGGGTLAINVQGTDIPGTLNGTDYLAANNSPGTGPSIKITATTNLSINLGTFTPSVGNSFTFATDATRTNEAYTSFFFVLGQDAGVEYTYNSTSNHVGKLFYIGANAFHIDYAGGSGGDLVLLSSVPEPGTAALLLGAVGILGGVVRRRRARNVPFGN